MRRSALLSCLLLAALSRPLQAQWTFSPSLEVAGAQDAFHHLEASGRQALSVSAGHVAITWEDDTSGTPRCHLAVKAPGQDGFRTWDFGHGECFAPGVTALAEGRFAVIWEDEAGVHAAITGGEGLGPTAHLAAAGGQGTLAWHPALGLMAAWSEPEGRWRRLWLARLALEGGVARLAGKQPANVQPDKDDQLYPALAATTQGYALAWEDRGLGHTVIFASHSLDGQAWTPPIRVSNNPTGKAQGTDLGRGTGAMRPVLAAYAGNLATVWLDKRDFLSGYDVYADLGGKTPRKNIKVQDSFGDAIAQWHPVATGNGRGELVVAWDDDRDGTSDIWLSWLTPQGEFAENVAPPPAAGPHRQTDPAIALEGTGELHLAWVEREPSGRSSVRYSLGHQVPRQ
jgi:hypothetical protein